VSAEGISVQLEETGVALVEFSRPPFNYFDIALIAGIADAYAELDADPRCRAIVLASPGRHFCAGADFTGSGLVPEQGSELYALAARLVEYSLPTVVAVQGRAIGGGLGLAMTGDFRVATPETQFVCNFALLGLHHGFGLTATLPAAVGQQRAMELLYTGRSVDGVRAIEIGLCDRLATAETARSGAVEFATTIAAAAPLAVRSIRRTMRGQMSEAIRAATTIELREQAPLVETEDFREGVRAAAARRAPMFTAR
jgi:enoyl-CoA hydratase/carnithine racemase